MNTEHTIPGIRELVHRARKGGQSVGLVPTMGALHSGHGALIERARHENDFVVVTIFVNPIQFNMPEDFEKYPRVMDTDLQYCEQLHVNAAFAPEAEEMYPEPLLTSVTVEKVSEKLCGEFRPGHFKGVATVVAKLFNIIPADRAYFGEKDFQQLALIRKMAADLNFAVEIVGVPTVREDDGLALSSRNLRLTAEHRKIAPVLYKALQAVADRVAKGASPGDARQAGLDMLATAPEFRLEYLEIVDPRRMQPVDKIASEVRIAAAAWLGNVRLIDNVRGGR